VSISSIEVERKMIAKPCDQKLKTGEKGKQRMKTRNYDYFENVLTHIQLNQFEN
jgi:hypothetical protein